MEKVSDNQCKKCGINDAIIKIGFKGAMCTVCFISSIRHKFRAALSSTKIVPKSSDVVLVFDGSPESYVMLDIVDHAITLNTVKKLRINPTIVYADTNLNQTVEQQIENRNKIKLFLSKYKYKSFYILLSDMKGTPIAFDEIDQIDQPSNGRLMKLYESIMPQTAQLDFIKIFKNRMIINATRKLNCKYCFVPDIGSNLAKTFISNMVLGRGVSVTKDISFCDHMSDVKLIRPLYEVRDDEIAHYIQIQNLESVVSSHLSEFESIQNVTKNFIEGLQDNYDSTITTVFKTGSKIDHKQFSELCSFCNAPLVREKAFTLKAIESSMYMSTNICKINIENSCIDLNESPNKIKTCDNLILCYGCYNIFKSTNNIEDYLEDLFQ